MNDVPPSTLESRDGLWLGPLPSRYGLIELVLDGTAESPKQQHLATLSAFMPQAGDTIERLRRRLPFSCLWRPIRLAPNDQNRVGVQFQRRVFHKQVMILTDE